MDKSSLPTANESRGPVTPPDLDMQNGINDDDEEEVDLSAQQAMQTPSPVNEEYELMEQNNAIVNEINSEFDDFVEDRNAEKPLTPVPVDIQAELIQEDVKMSDEGELNGKTDDELSEESAGRQEKRSKKKSNRKRRHSRSSNEEKKKLEKLKEMKFGSTKLSGQDSRRFNFRELENTPEKRVEVVEKRIMTPSKTVTQFKERRASPDPLDYYRSDKPHPILKTIRDLKNQSLPHALDILFTINPQDVAMLGKGEMIEVLDVMFDLNRRREKLTTNRMKLTTEVQSICNTELSLLNDLEHLMNQEERNFFHHLKQCPPSMDELAPFETKIAPTDVDLNIGTTRLYPVDLLPPSETPLIGRHDPNWDTFLKHIPPQFRGCPPPLLQDFQPYITPTKPNLNQPPPNFQQNAPIPMQPMTNGPPQIQPQSLASLNTAPPQSIAISQNSTITSSISSSQAMIVSSSGPPHNFSQPPPISSQPIPIHQQQPIESLQPINEIKMIDISSAPPPNFIPKSMEPMLNTDQPPPNIIPPSQKPLIGQPPIPITSIPPPNSNIRPLDIPAFPPPSSLDVSVPPPTFTSNITPMEHKQLSPVSAFRNTLKFSLLNPLGNSHQIPPSQNQRPSNDPIFNSTPPSSSMVFLQQPPPSLAGSSPQRFIPALAPIRNQSPQPLMSFEVQIPYQSQHPPQRHGKSPSNSFRSSKGNSLNSGKQQRRGGRSVGQKSANQVSPAKTGGRFTKDLDALKGGGSPASSVNSTTGGRQTKNLDALKGSGSPASSINSVAATIDSVSVVPDNEAASSQ